MDSLDQKRKSERHVDTDFFRSIDVSGSLGSFILGVLLSTQKPQFTVF